ncbi:Cag-like protein [Daphnia magna]|uniref:Cag-like protein n=1 Tax=Daphnia magna TaxID=35525 RepID=A0A0P6C5S4_9CRUS|nr:Cag-like protein [Daphnia magna]
MEQQRSASPSPTNDRPPSVLRDLIEMARSRGLSDIEYIQDGLKHWLNIGPSTSYRVPYGYSTHLMQLHIDSDLNFYLEALNRLVHTGCIRSSTTDRIDPNLAAPLLDSLNGGLTVCHGRGHVPDELLDLSHRKQAIEQGLLNGNFISYPDNRYRSHDCKFVIDGQTGATQCPSCAQPDDPCRRQRLDPFRIAPLSELAMRREQRDGRPLYTPTTGVTSPTTSTATTSWPRSHFRQTQSSQDSRLHQPHNLIGVFRTDDPT